MIFKNPMKKGEFGDTDVTNESIRRLYCEWTTLVKKSKTGPRCFYNRKISLNLKLYSQFRSQSLSWKLRCSRARVKNQVFHLCVLGGTPPKTLKTKSGIKVTRLNLHSKSSGNISGLGRPKNQICKILSCHFRQNKYHQKTCQFSPPEADVLHSSRDDRGSDFADLCFSACCLLSPSQLQPLACCLAELMYMGLWR